MTKEQAIIVKEEILKGDPLHVNGVWITNIQNTDFWFVDVTYYITYITHSDVKFSHKKIGYKE